MTKITNGIDNTPFVVMPPKLFALFLPDGQQFAAAPLLSIIPILKSALP